MISLIRRWLKAGILEDGEVYPNEEGTPQGGSLSVMLSNVYLHYVLDLWFERVVKPRLRGEAHMIRYIDDFVMCFQYREDALRVQDALCKRLGKFGLTLEPTQNKLVEFGRFAQRHAAKDGRKRPETIYFLGFTLYCTRNLKGNFRIGMRTEKSRLRRSLMSLQDLLRRIRHLTVREQVNILNAALRGHYAYYGIAGNFRSLQKVHRAVERYWHKMLCSRSWAGRMISWEQGRSIRFRRKPVGPDKLARRGRSDGLVEVRLADSTPRSGEPATWGSGQQKMNCSWETWALSKERSRLLCKEKLNQPWKQDSNE